MKTQGLLIGFLLLILTYQSQADTWSDPEWKTMIDSSDLIILAEYTSQGVFQATATPISIYKGTVDMDEIWVSGFSNRFGPLDTMKPGDTYILFLHKNQPTESYLEYWNGRAQEEPELAAYVQAMKDGNAYYVWTPTSGDLKIEGKTVQYDLLQTSFYRNQSFYPLKEFERFLTAALQPNNNRRFHKKTMKKVTNNLSEKVVAQYLTMLRLTSFQQYEPIFEKIGSSNISSQTYALAQLLGQVEGKKSRDILLTLLSNENSLVQGEAVRQLSNEPPDFIGPILLSHLNTAGEGGISPSSIMDPVRNIIDGGKIEMIKTLGNLKYKPAAIELLPLLETEDDYLFNLVIHVLIELESKDYIPYLEEHLKKGTKSLIFSICKIITRLDLTECKPALEKFILTHNRNDHPSREYSVSHSMGLAHFDAPETIDFLMKDFENLLLNKDTLESDALKDWIKEYIEVFTELKYKEARPLIYQSLFHWFGYNSDFIEHPILISTKEAIEDSISQTVHGYLSDFDVQEVEVLAHIQNSDEVVTGSKPKFEFIVLVKLTPETTSEDLPLFNNDLFETIKQARVKVSERMGIPIKKVSARCGFSVSHLDARFDVNSSSLMWDFRKYAEELPNERDLMFLKTLENTRLMEKDFDRRQLKATIDKIEKKLEN